jgi:hypothetical protein
MHACVDLNLCKRSFVCVKLRGRVMLCEWKMKMCVSTQPVQLDRHTTCTTRRVAVCTQQEE